MRAALPVIAMAVGAVAFVLAVVLRGGAGDVLSVLGLVLIGVGESPRVCWRLVSAAPAGAGTGFS